MGRLNRPRPTVPLSSRSGVRYASAASAAPIRRMMNATPCAVLSSLATRGAAATCGVSGTVGACSCGSSAGCTTGASGGVKLPVPAENDGLDVGDGANEPPVDEPDVDAVVE